MARSSPKPTATAPLATLAGGSTKQEWGNPGRFDLLGEHCRSARLYRCRCRQPDPLGGGGYDRGRSPRAGRRRRPGPSPRPGPPRPGHDRGSGGHRRPGGPGGRLRRAAGRGAGHPRHPGRRQCRQVRRAHHEERHRLRHDQAVPRILRGPRGHHRGHVPAAPPIRHPGADDIAACHRWRKPRRAWPACSPPICSPWRLEVVSADALPPTLRSARPSSRPGAARPHRPQRRARPRGPVPCCWPGLPGTGPRSTGRYER